MNRAEWVSFQTMLMLARSRRREEGIAPPHLDRDDQYRAFWQALILSALQDLGYNGYSVGGLYVDGDNDFRRYGRALDAADFIECEGFVYACRACGLSADKIRELSTGRISHARNHARKIGLLPPDDPGSMRDGLRQR